MAMNIVVVAAVWQSNAANAESAAPDFALFILRGAARRARTSADETWPAAGEE